jgi:chromosome partitioning protein
MIALNMSQILALVNQKGGVGKTTTTINLGAYLSALGRRVLLVDLDPQGNATSGLGVSRENFEYDLYSVLSGNASGEEALLRNRKFGYDLLPATADLAGAVVELIEEKDREYRLKGILEALVSNYDYILIDCPPSLGLLTINGLVAAQHVVIPVQCEYYALEGLGQLLSTIDLIKSNLHPDLKILGAVMTMFDRRNSLSRQVLSDMRKNFSEKLFDAVIPRSVSLAEAPSFGQSILEYRSDSKAAVAYKKLADEVVRILENKN